MKSLLITGMIVIILLSGCVSVEKRKTPSFLQTPEEATKVLLQQSGEIVSGKRDDYDPAVQTMIEPNLRSSMADLKKRAVLAKNESTGSRVSTFEIDTIPNDLVFLRIQTPDQEEIVSVGGSNVDPKVVVREKMKGDGRSKGYSGELRLLFHRGSNSIQLRDVIFRRIQGVPEWSLTDYLSDQNKKIDDLRVLIRANPN